MNSAPRMRKKLKGVLVAVSGEKIAFVPTDGGDGGEEGAQRPVEPGHCLHHLHGKVLGRTNWRDKC
jgi:hypothetical protein